MPIRETKPISAPATSGTLLVAVFYSRVSSKEQELGYSIAAQQDLLGPTHPNGSWRSKSSGTWRRPKTVGRPGFNAMLSHLKKHRDCRVVLVEKTIVCTESQRLSDD